MRISESMREHDEGEYLALGAADEPERAPFVAEFVGGTPELGVEVFQGKHAAGRTFYRLDRGFVLGLIAGGSPSICQQGKKQQLKPGSTWLLSPLLPQGWDSAGGFTETLVYIAPQTLCQGSQLKADLQFVRCSFRLACADDPALTAHLVRLSALAHRNSASIKHEIEDLCRTLRQRFLAIESPDAESKVWAAAKYLEENITRDVSLDALSDHTKLSKFHLLRTFREAVGVSPMTYARMLRVLDARARLRAGCSSKMAAFHAGFADKSHLSREFKRVLGITPGEYARGIRDAQSRGMTA